MDGSPSGKGTVPVTRNATPSKFCTPPHRLSTASLSGVARCWHSNAYFSLFSSLFFFDFHRTDLSRFRGTFHSFDPVGFAIFAILRASVPGWSPFFALTPDAFVTAAQNAVPRRRRLTASDFADLKREYDATFEPAKASRRTIFQGS